MSPVPTRRGGVGRNPKPHGLGTMLGTCPLASGGRCWGRFQHHRGIGGSGATRGGGPVPRDVPCVPNRPIVDLMGTTETPSEPSELELDDVVITNPHIEAILENEDWVEDAS